MVKKIVLLGAAPIGAEMRLPSQGPLSVPDDLSAKEAQALIDVGLAKPADADQAADKE